MTPRMEQWDRWGRTVLRDGDIVFRLGDARVLFGYFPFSRFIANVSGSKYSHVGTVAIEDGAPVVYDTAKPGVRRQPFQCFFQVIGRQKRDGTDVRTTGSNDVESSLIVLFYCVVGGRCSRENL